MDSRMTPYPLLPYLNKWPFLEEFISLWDQVQSISQTLPEQAKHLIHPVDDKVAEIRSPASEKPMRGDDGEESQSTADLPQKDPLLGLAR